MQDLYFDEARARAVLIEIGCPARRIPVFRAAETFWPEVILLLEAGMVRDGLPLLLAVAAPDHPGNDAAPALLAQIREKTGAVKVLKVLALFSDPLRKSKIRIDREARMLQEIARSGGFELATRHAVQVNDIIKAVLDEKPNILHFAGHGTQDGQLVFEDDRGVPTDVGSEELARAIAASSGSVLNCVVLNSCFTAGSAAAFRVAARAVAGSSSVVEDPCALAFAQGFYTGIGAGQTVAEAYRTGQAQMNFGNCGGSGLDFVSFPVAP